MTGIVIGYDHRTMNGLSSQGFARITAAVFLSRGYKVYVLENLVPTPFVAFATTYLNCAAGIMVTASHNPKADNGYKVYWGNGSQIIPPHDSGIAASIMANLQPWQATYDQAGVLQHPLCENATDSITKAYYDKLMSLCTQRDENNSSSLKTVYTAMHGVGTPWINKAFELFNHKPPTLVSEQCLPDPEFTTVSFPNPEEKGALDLAMQKATSSGVGLIIASDPDADRLAVAEFQSDSNKWHIFSGNEIGTLLGSWSIEKYGTGGNRKAVLASIVSSRMLKAIAEGNGIEYYDTLTGFKWLGNRAIELRADGVNVLFAYEEALGYSVGDVVSDKDGVAAASVFVEMASFLHAKSATVHNYLQSLYKKYGEFVSLNSYVICHDPVITASIFSRLRTQGPNGGYWDKAGGGIDIISIKDVTKGYDSSAVSGDTSTIPATPDSEMIMFEFANGCTVTLRTSGTEPKIKYYTEKRGAAGESRTEVQESLNNFVELLVQEMLQPDKYGLARA